MDLIIIVNRNILGGAFVRGIYKDLLHVLRCGCGFFLRN